MTCPICRRGDDVEHGRVLCQWRRHPSAWGVRAAWEIERHARSPEPGTDRLRLAWWVVTHADRIDGEALRGRPAHFASRAIDAARAVQLEPCDECDRAQRDIARYAANRWALAALEAIQ